MLYRAIKKNEVFQSLKEEYDYAKEKERYYVNLFNKQDNLYSVFFVIFSLIIGAVYHITTLDGSEASAGILAFQENELIISLLICVLAIIYTYFYIWETEFMSKIQSKSNVLQKGYLNVNYIKTALAFLQYGIIHAGLAVMWFVLPSYYRQKLQKLYEDKLGIKLT